jgi:hypothetical protein
MGRKRNAYQRRKELASAYGAAGWSAATMRENRQLRDSGDRYIDRLMPPWNLAYSPSAGLTID